LTLPDFRRTLARMAKKSAAHVGQASRLSPKSKKKATGNGRADLPVSQDAWQCVPTNKLRYSSLLDTRVVYCGDNREQLAKLPDACVDLIYSATAGRPRCVQLARVLKKTGSFYYHCDRHASHYVKVMLN
jgi:hypothetical protein